MIKPNSPIKAEYAPLSRITFLIRSACFAPMLNATIGIKALFNPKTAIYTNVCNLKYAPNTAVDVVEKGGSKVTGIQKYLSIKEYTREEAAAFGDGENDIEMLRYVQEGIAMGNANDFVKSIADYVTADIDDNGIEKGLRYLGLL